MEWDKKTTLCKLANAADDKETRAKFCDFVIENMKDFDEQAWDMFFTGIVLTREFIDENIEKHKQIFNKAQNLTSESFRTCMRMALYETLIQEYKG